MIKDSKKKTLTRRIEYCYVTDIRNCECAQVINKKSIERGDYIG